MGTDYNEIICTAIDTIVSSKIEQLQYDVTKVCLIDDDSMAAQGKYVVADGAAKYEAFTNDTSLRKGNSVQVLIPNGDYNMQKTIISRIAATDTTPYNYTSPMDAMVKITNNVFLGVPITGLLANEDSPQGIIVEDGSEKTVSKSILIHEINNLEELGGYTRLGVEVDLRTWLPSDTVSGTYGIQLKIITKDNIVYSLQPFTNNEMYGNPYQFIHNFTQQMVYDISGIDSIKTIQAYLFEDGKFKNDKDEYIPWQEEFDGEIIKSSKNIFVDDLRLYFGYDKNELSDNFIQIYSSEGLYFGGERDKTERNLYTRWFHKDENNNFNLMPESAIRKETYEIKWFQYTGNMSYDENDPQYEEAGWGWHIIQDYDVSKPFYYNFYTESSSKSYSFKVICYEYFDYGTSDNNKKSYNTFVSNTLTFTNRREIADQATITANNALSIECMDNSNGNYFLYNSLGQILRSELGKDNTRYLKANFSQRFLQNYKEITGIRWILPSTDLSMLDFEWTKEENASFWVDGVNIKGNLSGDVFTINLNGVNPESLIVNNPVENKAYLSYLQFPYSIKNQQSYNLTDNTVNCEIELDGITFYAVKQFTFGRISSEASGLSLSLSFEDDQTALIAQGGSSITAKANLYYFGNDELFEFGGSSGFSDSITWDWYRQNTSEEEVAVQFESGIRPGEPSKSDTAKIVYTGPSDSFPEKHCAILQATFSRNYNNGNPFTIISYLPVPIKASEEYINLDGTTQVVYEISGKPTYTPTPYNLTSATGKIDEIFLYSEVFLGENKDYLPKLSVGMDGATPALKASDLNIKINDDRMSILVKDNDKSVWIQPILIQQNQEVKSSEQSWNEDVLIGSEAVITNTSLGRGSVTNDGKVSGIFIGDKKETINEQESLNTGIYGAKLNELSYYLNENGDFYFYHEKLKIDPNSKENIVLKFNDKAYFDFSGVFTGEVNGLASQSSNLVASDENGKEISYDAIKIKTLENNLSKAEDTINTLINETIAGLRDEISLLKTRIEALEKA